MSGIDDIAVNRDLQAAIRSRNPASWIEGIAHVLGNRKQLLMGELEYASGGRVLEISHQIDALKKIGGLAGAASPEAASVRNPRKRKDGQSKSDHTMELTRILTPSGWRLRFEEPLEDAQQSAREEMLERKDVEANRAFLEESRRIIRFLDLVERDGQKEANRMRSDVLKKVS